MRVRLYHTLGYLLLAALAFSAVSCTWIREDLPECPPTELRVDFRYDYHTFGGDVFKDQVGGLYVYMFDEEDRFMFLRTETDPAKLGTYGYEMVFDNLEPGRYRFVTLAFQKSLDEIYDAPGAKFRMPEMQEGDPIEKLEISLDREENTADGTFAVVHENSPLDTLWMNRTENTVEMKYQQTTRATVSLMRYTKNISVTLRQIDDPADIDCNDFDISITEDNGCVMHDGSVKENDALLTYTPYATWTSEYSGTGERSSVERAAHADLSIPRLIYSGDAKENAILTIRNRKTGKDVARINLQEMLASGRNSAELSYPAQEFLDREHEYKLDFFLIGDTWARVEIEVHMNSWTERNHSTDL